MRMTALSILGQHHIPVLTPLGLDDPDDLLGAVNITDLEPDDFTRAHTAAISQRQHHARLQTGSHGQDAANSHFPPDLLALRQQSERITGSALG